MKLYWEANVSPIPFPKHSENNNPTTSQNIAVYAPYLNFTNENALQKTTCWTDKPRRRIIFILLSCLQGNFHISNACTQAKIACMG